MNALPRPGAQPVALPPRPQVGIERLPTRHITNEPRESMNCKSCRKRKIKCNRMRPSCEACQVFQCPCIYDAVPKKRGPKTDVLEALLKRVDGLEAKLKEKNAEGERSSDSSSQEPATVEASSSKRDFGDLESGEPAPKRIATEDSTSSIRELPIYTSPTASAAPSSPSSHLQNDNLLDVFFSRCQNKPYHIVDEASTRKRAKVNELPPYLMDAIAAVATRHIPHPHGYQAAAKLSNEYAARSRAAIDTDEPSIDAIHTLFLLVLAFIAAGKGKKAYMLLSVAVGMIMALELHREIDAQSCVAPGEREQRRRMFWTCYLLDRFTTSGSKRPSLVSDDCIFLRLPAWSPNPASLPVDGEFFLCGSNLQYFQGTGKKSQGSSGMLIDITRILGITNRYLAAGGVKGDSHFPWHSLSNLSKIRHDLDVWASGSENIFTSIDLLLNHADSTVLVLCKLIYHLIHCLIYRPFLPISLAELAGTGQHQSWQIEATNMCFFHANAIAELTSYSKQASAIEWPAFVGYCICTAATVHIHGAHYGKQGNGNEMNMFGSSDEFLAREMKILSDLRFTWAIVQHQRDMLQRLYDAHGELIKSLTNNGMRYTPGFQLEDFFDRYSNIGGPGGVSFHFDTANLSLADEMIDYTNEPEIQASWGIDTSRPNLKRKTTAQSPHAMSEVQPVSAPPLHTPALAGATYPPNNPMLQASLLPTHSSPGSITSLLSPPPMEHSTQHMSAMRSTADVAPAPNSQMPDYALAHAHAHPGGLTPMGNMAFGGQYAYNIPTPRSNGQPVMNDAGAGYDAMFGAMQPNYSSPSAWPTDGVRAMMSQTTPAAAAPSPSTKSNTGSTGTVGDEKDPFMSLLEQLANDEQRQQHGLKNELDFYLSGVTGVS